MTAAESDVIESFMKTIYGPVLSKISRLILRGVCSVNQIQQQSDFPLSQVKEALCHLVKFNFVTCRLTSKLNAIYRANTKNMKLVIRYPKLIHLIKRKFGDEAETLIEIVLHSGCITASELIARVVTILKEDKSMNVSVKEVKDKFVSLVNAKYVKHFKDCNSNEVEDSFVLPNIDIQVLIKNMNNESDREDVGDEGVYWTLNPDRFNQDIRDNLIVQSIRNKFDDNAGELMRVMLEQMYIRTLPWENVSNPIPIFEIKEIVKKQNTHPDLVTHFDQYVTLLEEHTCEIITKAGAVGGGSYQIEMKEIMKHLAYDVIRYVIEERFGPEAARIYALIVVEKYIEIEQIVNIVMLPLKDINLLVYELLENSFIFMSEMKRSTSNSGSFNRPTVMFYTKLTATVNSIMNLCYVSLYKEMTRKEHEKSLNKQIIDKKRRVDTIMLAMRAQQASEEQLADIEDMITPPEYELLTKIDGKLRKLDLVELEIDDTIFLLETYLHYK